ncbi:hypothetical protein [Mycolicibacterium austroafricanum]|uniref:hypothetical protein n=1 Tax=Mycolicibacterium austroafricanum TaxID=39687 RepID=UPI000CF8D82C|nr:hypothetical protein [Mycolicibacterium austroafricanum]PQP43171.1 hypothetical protein C6A88_24700 [Mycolicibacterium austroafricanum]QZT55794.1 hypothetical protein JN084_23065 [Mycolicibacterium austroafricanum]
MDYAEGEPQFRRLTTPRSAAVAGVLFAVLFAASLVLLRSAIPDDPFAQIAWVNGGRTRIGAALVLAPMAAIAFLWFIGVMRDVLGDFEDRFFASVFFGSGLLFVAMTAVSMGIAGAILTITEIPGVASNGLIYFGRSLMLQISNVWGVRLAAVFMISLATIWIRTGLMPRWTAVITYLVAALLIVVVSLSLWVTLVFPAWVGAVSLMVLFTRPGPHRGAVGRRGP